MDTSSDDKGNEEEDEDEEDEDGETAAKDRGDSSEPPEKRAKTASGIRDPVIQEAFVQAIRVRTIPGNEPLLDTLGNKQVDSEGGVLMMPYDRVNDVHNAVARIHEHLGDGCYQFSTEFKVVDHETATYMARCLPCDKVYKVNMSGHGGKKGPFDGLIKHHNTTGHSKGVAATKAAAAAAGVVPQSVIQRRFDESLGHEKDGPFGAVFPVGALSSSSLSSFSSFSSSSSSSSPPSSSAAAAGSRASGRRRSVRALGPGRGGRGGVGGDVALPSLYISNCIYMVYGVLYVLYGAIQHTGATFLLTG
jgi:hypothetical protein